MRLHVAGYFCESRRRKRLRVDAGWLWAPSAPAKPSSSASKGATKQAAVNRKSPKASKQGSAANRAGSRMRVCECVQFVYACVHCVCRACGVQVLEHMRVSRAHTRCLGSHGSCDMSHMGAHLDPGLGRLSAYRCVHGKDCSWSAHSQVEFRCLG